MVEAVSDNVIDMLSDATYRVVVTREGDAWLADVPDLPGAHTYARTLPALNKAVREVVILAADLPEDALDSVELEWTFHTGNPELDDEAAQVRLLRAHAEQAMSEATERTAKLAQRLVADGTSVRDVATLLGISAQRVSQVTSGPHRTSGREYVQVAVES